MFKKKKEKKASTVYLMYATVVLTAVLFSRNDV